MSRSHGWIRHGRRLAAMLLATAAQPAFAGPPYLTDDPVPTDTHHWEIYAYTDDNALHGQHEGEAGFDINYGLVKDVQLTTVITGAYASGDAHGMRLNDTELGVKYRFINDTSADLQVSSIPRWCCRRPRTAGRSRMSCRSGRRRISANGPCSAAAGRAFDRGAACGPRGRKASR